MVADIIHVCDLSIVFQFPNVFSSSIFLHLCYRYRLAMMSQNPNSMQDVVQSAL
jgi:ABC-type phosphate transport system ATPase subunit